MPYWCCGNTGAAKAFSAAVMLLINGQNKQSLGQAK
jgi:hypothetical protein